VEKLVPFHFSKRYEHAGVTVNKLVFVSKPVASKRHQQAR